MEAADLGALQIRPPLLAKLRAALAEASTEWGRAAQAGFFFVARSQPPVKLQGQGVLVLGMNQEIYAWLPGSGRYLPITSEDGRVLVFAESPDGRRIVFVRAGRLVRTPVSPTCCAGSACDNSTLAAWPWGRRSSCLGMCDSSPWDIPAVACSKSNWPGQGARSQGFASTAKTWSPQERARAVPFDQWC